MTIDETPDNSASERLRRPEPQRTEPTRNFQTYWRQGSAETGQPADAAMPAGNPGSGPRDNVIASGVELGYRVIDEQIKQGQRFAKQFSGAGVTDPLGRGSGGAADFLGRILRSYSDMGALWMDLLRAAASDPMLINSVLNPTRAASGGEARTAKHTREGTVEIQNLYIEIVCPEPTEVAIDFRCPAYTPDLVVLPLHAMDSDKPALKEITLMPGSKNVSPRLRVVIPAGQPPDSYTGTVVDANSGEPQGTLSIRLSQ